MNLPARGLLKQRLFWYALCGGLFLCPLRGVAQEAHADAEGCKDSPLLTRFPGTTLYECQHKDFDGVSIPVSKDADGNGQEKSIEGDVYTYQYSYTSETSELQIYRNLLNAVQKAGYMIDYQESPSKFTAHRGGQYISTSIGGGAYTLYTIQQKAMEQVVTATAAEMRSEIEKSGHVAIYGVEFATGKAEVLPGSDTVLNEVLRLLTENAALKLRIEGHTDNTGKRDVNQRLSEQRAAAVVNWLASKGVDRGRLTAQGFADSKPVADNSTEDGRAKNRRVELVKIS